MGRKHWVAAAQQLQDGRVRYVRSLLGGGDGALEASVVEVFAAGIFVMIGTIPDDPMLVLCGLPGPGFAWPPRQCA